MKYIKKNKGFTLIELLLTLSIGTAITFMAFNQFLKTEESKLASSTGRQLKDVGTAVNNYIVNHYNDISALKNSVNNANDVGPRTCFASTSTCVITTQTLVGEGFLPPNFSGKNAYGSGYAIVLKRAGSTPYWNVSGLITTDTPLKIASSIRYDLLGRAMQEAGVDSGMSIKAANQIDGFKGSWQAFNSDYNNITQLGQLGFIAGYGSNSFSAFLRRDGTLPMTGDLNMGTQSINNSKDINGSGNLTMGANGTFGQQVNAGSWVNAKNGYGDTISLGGDAAGSDYELKMGGAKPLTIWNTATDANRATTVLNVYGTQRIAGNLSVNASNSANGDISSTGQVVAQGKIRSESYFEGKNGGGDGFRIGGSDSNDVEFALYTANKPLTVWRSGGASNENRFNVLGTQINSGDLRVQAGGDGTTTGQILASGNITSSQVVTGLYLNPSSVVTMNGYCPQNGYISKNSIGEILSCVNNKWSTIGNLPVGSPVPWPTNNPPSGWLICNGQSFNTAAYPELAKAYPTGVLPDLRGVFIRGNDNGRGFDSGRSINTYQADQIQNITGYMPADIGQSAYIGRYVGGAFTDTGGIGGGDTGYRGGEVRRYSFDASRVVRAGNETRPKNVSMNYIVQAK